MINTTRVIALSLLAVAACGKGKSQEGSSAKVTEGAPKAPSVPEAPPVPKPAPAPEPPPAKPAFAPCDAASVAALAADLDKANCLEVDLSKKALTDACKAKERQITGKTYAFKGCTFAGQGNDVVSFGATGTDKTIECVMKGGEAGVTGFREAAMKLDTDKLRLEVTGVIAKVHGYAFDSLKLTDCEITAHE